MSAHSSDSESEYILSAPPSPSALSYDSSAETTDTETSSPALSAMSIDDTKEKLVYPPLTLSAMVVQANQSGEVLTNPLVDKTTADALAQLSAPGVNKDTTLRNMIAVFESDPETAEMYRVAGLADESMARSIVDRYAETVEVKRARELRKDLDLAPYVNAITHAFDTTTDTPDGADKLIKELGHNIEILAYLVPRGSAYPPRGKALEGLVLVAQRTRTAPVSIKRGIMASAVGTKLGLALRKMVKEAGWPEDKKKHWGYMKRTGVAEKIKEVLGWWEDVRVASGGLEEVVN